MPSNANEMMYCYLDEIPVSQNIFKFGGSERYFQHFSRDMYPKNRPRRSVKRQVFSVLTSVYFQGPVNMKNTVYSSTSTLNTSQYCMM